MTANNRWDGVRRLCAAGVSTCIVVWFVETGLANQVALWPNVPLLLIAMLLAVTSLFGDVTL